jgi:hypothetical protein
MSANNYCLVSETKDGYEVSVRDADTDSIDILIRKEDFREAMKLAQDLSVDCEYGIHIKFKKDEKPKVK